MREKLSFVTQLLPVHKTKYNTKTIYINTSVVTIPDFANAIRIAILGWCLGHDVIRIAII